jgi:4-aminobutyrate aminotransferase-like enzyme
MSAANSDNKVSWNFCNQWGRNTLPMEAFASEEYINFLLPFAGIENYETHKQTDSAWTPTLVKLIQSNSSALKYNPKTWNLLAACNSGSDANNLLIGLATEAARRNQPEKSIQKASILTFDCMYVVSKGELSGHCALDLSAENAFTYKMHTPEDKKTNQIIAPWTDEYMKELVDGVLRCELNSSEVTALETIAAYINQSRNTNSPIGLLLVEPITSTNLLGLSSVFLSELRKLCSKFSIYLASDEILTGLKTWSPFVSLLYNDFAPDFITFGKSFLMCGILALDKSPEIVKHLRQYIRCIGIYVLRVKTSINSYHKY